jgi:hypothetical protein
MENPTVPPLPPVASPVPQAGQVVVDNIPCRKCAYNLRTLSVTGVCPECGTPVGVSIYGDLLKYSDPAWVRKLGQGAFYILLGIFVVIATVLLTVVLGAARILSPPANEMFGHLLNLVGSVLTLIGSWLLTEPDPSGVGEDKYGTSRKVIRVTLLIDVLNSFLTFISTFSILPPQAHQLLQGVTALCGIAGVVGMFAQLQYLGKLALRIPDKSLSDRANFLKIAFSITYGFLILIGIVTVLIMWGRTPNAGNLGVMIPIGCVGGIAGIAAVVFGVMYLFMIDRFRRGFNSQAVLAEETWSGHPRASSPG